MYWFTNSYRKKQAKFRNNLLDEAIRSFASRLWPHLCDFRAYGPQGRGYRLEAFSQRDVPTYDP
jgi:hypothetical protein